ncbi:carbohydrate sulfotransferase 11-like [Watersipora subatra]|uniref:carbohydrate sulfotransferase 11-like n=1 Tax=Watersipora subatra TaxID=2589382 RepID=UPI00355AE7B6
MELQVEQWRPDWYYEKDIGTLLDNRIKNARERCISFNNTKNAWSKEPHPEVTVSGCLEYCHTYKAAGTFWKRLLKNSRSSQLQSPLRVTTTRNPWHRLVSLYTHQMVSLSGTHLQQKINKFCLKDFKRRPSFREFIKNCVISQWRANNFNLHWMPTMEGCDICGGHVDLIVAVENIAEESSYILQKAGIKNAKSFVSQIRKKSIRTNEKQALSADYQSYYKNIDIADIRALQSLYAFDIYALGYPKTPFVDFQYS